jgi:hypothetical protein
MTISLPPLAFQLLLRLPHIVTSEAAATIADSYPLRTATPPSSAAETLHQNMVLEASFSSPSICCWIESLPLLFASHFWLLFSFYTISTSYNFFISTIYSIYIFWCNLWSLYNNIWNANVAYEVKITLIIGIWMVLEKKLSCDYVLDCFLVTYTQ